MYNKVTDKSNMCNWFLTEKFKYCTLISGFALAHECHGFDKSVNRGIRGPRARGQTDFTRDGTDDTDEGNAEAPGSKFQIPEKRQTANTNVPGRGGGSYQ